MEKGTIYIPEFCNSSFGEQSPAYCLSLIFAAQKSLLIDYSALIRLSLRISLAVAHSSMFGHKPRQCFRGSFLFLSHKSSKALQTTAVQQISCDLFVISACFKDLS